jgi:ABC-type transport system substrate-binding protein
MSEAGWTPGPDRVLTKDGQRFSFKFTGSMSPANQQVAAAMQQSWKALGMESEIELLEFGVFINQRRDTHKCRSAGFRLVSPSQTVRLQNALLENGVDSARHVVERH